MAARIEALRVYFQWRALFALLAVTGTVLVATLALTPLHGHAQQRNCDVCTSAHLPWLQAAAPVYMGPALVVAWAVASESFTLAPQRSTLSRQPRAPPL
jgi:hypothetical protein